MFRTALVTLVASLLACSSMQVTAAAAASPRASSATVTQPLKPSKASPYFAYKVRITNGVPK